ncbi:MAG: hypothetical protein KF817_06735 [Phycisphaeraceae bacterium]|nr:hypothetical protein [Phycisphaeraceae bacterium]
MASPPSAPSCPPRAEIRPAALLLALVAALPLVLVLARGGEAIPAVGPALIAGLWPVGTWFAGAGGLAVILHRAGLGARREPLLSLALGMAVFLCLAAALGRAGLLNRATAWLLCAAPCALAVPVLRRGRPWSSFRPPPRIDALWLAALPPAATLIVAALCPPGLLWRSEFGGYDVLSYHLQLPAEWLADGRVSGLTHNVYSFLPSFVEVAFLHLALLHPHDAHTAVLAAAVPSQLLHALILGLAILLAGRAAVLLAPDAPGARRGGAVTILLLLGTPWLIVTGSLAYNEAPLVLALAAGLVALLRSHRAGDAGTPPDHHDDRIPARRLWIPLALLVGAACGAKPTALFLVGAPLAAALLILAPPRTGAGLVRCVLIGGAVGALPLIPWLAQNGSATGNPLFPFATGVFGTGHWSAAQAERWAAAHGPPAIDPGAACAALVHRFLRPGIGPAPASLAGEPWLPQWSLLPVLGLASAGMLAARLRSAPPVARGPVIALLLMLAVQVLAWLLLTHQQSRFLLPAAVPLALCAALLISGVSRSPGRPSPGRVWSGLGAAALALWCLLPPILLRGESADGREPLALIGHIDLLTGDAFRDAARSGDLDPRAIAALGPPLWINHLLGAEARILGVGFATPLYIRHAGLVYATVWDDGPMPAFVRDHQDRDALIGALRAAGVTHLLVDETMLRVWRRSGWLDPALTDGTIAAVVGALSPPMQRHPSGLSLYALSPAPRLSPR